MDIRGPHPIEPTPPYAGNPASGPPAHSHEAAPGKQSLPSPNGPDAKRIAAAARSRALQGFRRPDSGATKGVIDSHHRFQHGLAVTTRRLSAHGMEEVLAAPDTVRDILENYGGQYDEYLHAHWPEGFPADQGALKLKFRKGIANGALQHQTLLHVLVDVLRDPARLQGMLQSSFPRVKGDYFAFELDGPGGENGFTFFDSYGDARHNLMAAAVRLFANSHARWVQPSQEWSAVEQVKAELTETTKAQGLRAAYRRQPEPGWPPTVWSLSQNLNSSLVSLRAALVAVNQRADVQGWSWADVQRLFFVRPGDLKGLAGVTVDTLGGYTQPNPLPEVEVGKDPALGKPQSYKWTRLTEERLKHDPGGICFGFSSLHEQPRTSDLEAEIRKIFDSLDIQMPRRFSSVEMLTMVGALLMPHLGPDYPQLSRLGARTLTDDLAAVVNGRSGSTD